MSLGISSLWSSSFGGIGAPVAVTGAAGFGLVAGFIGGTVVGASAGMVAGRVAVAGDGCRGVTLVGVGACPRNRRQNRKPKISNDPTRISARRSCEFTIPRG